MVDSKVISDWQILTPDGWCDFYGIGLVKYAKTKKVIIDDSIIEGSNNHFVRLDNELVALGNLPGEESIEEKALFDILTVDNEQHLYLTNGIPSHNCEFLGSNDSLVSSTYLNILEYKPPIEVGFDGAFQVYKRAEKEGKYIICVDVATGIGKDYTVASIIRVDSPKFEQVAMYRSNTIEIAVFPYVLEKIGKAYNWGLMLIENNVADTVGYILFNEIEYPELYVDIETKKVGMRTTVRTKMAGTQLLKEYIENMAIEIYSIELIEELSTFARNKKTYSAQAGSFDDIVMSFVLFSYFTKEPYFKEFCDFDHIKSIYKNKMASIMDEQMSPILRQDHGISADESLSDGSGSITNQEVVDFWKR